MKHVVLIALGCVLSFMLAIVWSPFVHVYLSKNFSSIGTYYSRHEYVSLWLFLNLFVLCILMAFSIIAGKVCISDAERQKFKLLFTRGSIVGAICLNCGVLFSIFNVSTNGGEAGVAAVFAVFIVIPIGIGLHLGFTWLFLAIMKWIIQTGINASSEKPNEKESTLWVGVSLTVVCVSILVSLSEPAKLSNPTINPSLPDSLKVNAEIARRNSHNEAMFRHWTIQADSGRQYLYTIRNPKNGFVAEYCKTTGRDGMVHYLVRKVYDKRKKLLFSQPFNKPIPDPFAPIHIDSLHNREVVEKILSYSRKEISLKDLVEWAQYVFF